MTDCPADLSVPAPQPNPSSEPKVTVTGVDGVTRIVQGVEGEIPDGVEYTFGPCEICGEASFCEHERVSQPVVSSSRAVDLDLDQIEADLADVPAELFGVRTSGDGPMRRLIASVPALVAEVRRLRERLDEERRGAERLSQWYNAAQAECDAARAEAEELRQAYRTVCDYAAQHDATRAELNEARAEAERLREALEDARLKIAELSDEIVVHKAAKEVLRAEAGRVREALQAVRELHVAYDCTEAGEPSHETCGDREWCYTCGESSTWPCETVRALDAALDGAE